MKYIDVLPISHDYLVLYDEGGVSLLPKSEPNLSPTEDLLCFRPQKILFSFLGGFYWDLDVLCRLRGKKPQSLTEALTEAFPNECSRYTELSNRINANIRSYSQCSIDIRQHSALDLFGKDLLEDFYRERGRLCFMLWEQTKDEEVFSFYRDKFFHIHKNLQKINDQNICIDLDKLPNLQGTMANILKKQIKDKDHIKLKFKSVGARTGRSAFERRTFNPYSLPREQRGIIKAREGYSIVQFDYKSFQPRIAISQTQDEDFRNKFLESEDLYSEFGEDREKIKLSFLSWLFSDAHSEVFDSKAQPIREHRSLLYEQYLSEGRLVNIFGRPIFFGEKDMPHLVYQHYITSLEADMVLSLSSFFLDKLKNSQDMRFLFPFYDAFIFEISDKKLNKINNISEIISTYHKEVFNGTIFPVEVKKGKTFGDLKK